ncbi:MAG: hypothetical protein ACTXOO_03480 [Sodalis sp. (in: enterobacteria)]
MRITIGSAVRRPVARIAIDGYSMDQAIISLLSNYFSRIWEISLFPTIAPLVVCVSISSSE